MSKKTETKTDEYAALRLENQLCFPLYACSREIVKKYTPFLKPLKLTYTQYLVMMVLWVNKFITVGELGNKLYLDTGTLTPMLKKMQDEGFIDRTRSADDERVVIISITKKGMALREKCKDIPKEIGGCVKLSPEDAQALYKTLYQMIDGFN
ncbi:MAG: MarR family transcriptional regulator [Lachnospiraceae bacterium]|nr:MarR family transcriptional regulator [Lachnospiraceae bacterium]